MEEKKKDKQLRAKKKKTGRPLKYKTPKEFEDKAEKVFQKIERENQVPTITLLEVMMDCSFYCYERREEFLDIVTRTRKRAYSIYEQKALKREISERLSSMYLARHIPDDYVGIQSIEVKQQSTVDYKGINELMRNAMNLEGKERESVISSFKEALSEDEG